MKLFYCSKCGTRLIVTRRALPKWNRIVDIVSYHTCPEELVELDLTPEPFTTNYIQQPGDNEFVQKLNSLAPPSAMGPGFDQLKDRRTPEQVKNTAPRGVLDLIKDLIKVRDD